MRSFIICEASRSDRLGSLRRRGLDIASGCRIPRTEVSYGVIEKVKTSRFPGAPLFVSVGIICLAALLPVDADAGEVIKKTYYDHTGKPVVLDVLDTKRSVTKKTSSRRVSSSHYYPVYSYGSHRSSYSPGSRCYSPGYTSSRGSCGRVLRPIYSGCRSVGRGVYVGGAVIRVTY